MNDADPLNPSKEQELFEKLSMEDEDYGFLQYIRRHMRHIREERDESKRHQNNKD